MNLQSIRALARRLAKDNNGAAITEYVIIVGVIAVLAIGGYQTFGANVKAKVETQGQAIGNLQ